MISFIYNVWKEEKKCSSFSKETRLLLGIKQAKTFNSAFALLLINWFICKELPLT